jgi:hypothetical protein
LSNATICPEVLICSEENITPEVFDKQYMSVAAGHIKECKSLELHLEICSQVLDSVLDSFPWQNVGDPEWKQYIFDWIKGVISELERVSTVYTFTADDEQNEDTVPCALNQQVCKQGLFMKWLEHWASGYKCKGRYIKGIGTNVNCRINFPVPSCLCGEFYIFAQYTEWRYLKYPWLLLYDKRLPVEGKFPFQPQNNWITLNSAPKGSQHGFLDKSGNEWCWDASHGGHWDVQLSSSGYRRVNQDGQSF